MAGKFGHRPTGQPLHTRRRPRPPGPLEPLPLPVLRRDRTLIVGAEALERRLVAWGVADYGLLVALEGQIGGLSFNKGAIEVVLGLYLAFEAPFDVAGPPTTVDGRVLVPWAFSFDTNYYLTAAGEVWEQDGTVHHCPIWRADDLRSFVLEVQWPLGDALAPLEGLMTARDCARR